MMIILFECDYDVMRCIRNFHHNNTHTHTQQLKHTTFNHNNRTQHTPRSPKRHDTVTSRHQKATRQMNKSLGRDVFRLCRGFLVNVTEPLGFSDIEISAHAHEQDGSEAGQI